MDGEFAVALSSSQIESTETKETLPHEDLGVQCGEPKIDLLVLSRNFEVAKTTQE